jgi:hypothetical protein
MAKQNDTKERKKLAENGKRMSDSGRVLDYSEGWGYVNLRIPLRMLQEIDEHLLGRRPKNPRMYWIIRAILEKMEREKQKNS